MLRRTLLLAALGVLPGCTALSDKGSSPGGTVLTQVQKDAAVLNSVITQMQPLLVQVTGLSATQLSAVQAAVMQAEGDVVTLLQNSGGASTASQIVSAISDVFNIVSPFIPVGGGIMLAIRAILVLASTLVVELGGSPPSVPAAMARAAVLTPDQARAYLQSVAKNGIRP